MNGVKRNKKLSWTRPKVCQEDIDGYEINNKYDQFIYGLFGECDV